MQTNEGGAEKVPPFLLKQELEEVISLRDKIILKDKIAIEKLKIVNYKISKITLNDCDRCILAALSRVKQYYYLKFENVSSPN